MIPANVSTVLFDVGNTLNHLDHALLAEIVGRHWRAVDAADLAAAEYVAKAEVDEQIRNRRGGTDAGRRRGYFETMFEHLGVPEAAMAAIGEELRTENERRSLWRVVPSDAHAVMGELARRGFTLGVVSNADGRVEAALREDGLAPYFAAIVDSHVVGVEKPDPRIFHLALEGCGAEAAQTVYVGDIYEIDVRGARDAGLTAILIDPLSRYEAVDCPRIDRLSGLLEMLPHRARRREVE